MKILSYNIHKGFNFGSKKFVLKEIKKEVIEINPDLIFLQEVHGRHDLLEKKIKGWPTEAQDEFIANPHYKYRAYGKNFSHKHGHHGNAILSKFPISFSENINISVNKLEKRGVLHVILEKPKVNPIHLFCVHLNLLEKSRTRQVKLLIEIVKERVKAKSPVIIAGDFNDWRGRVSRTLETQLKVKDFYLSKNGFHARTFPSKIPTLPLDRIYFKNFKLSEAHCLSAEVFRNLSDHLPVFAVFKSEELSDSSHGT
jgi:endonuclease/exonuclease/phosphatase family metal-dependent hydrolase